MLRRLYVRNYLLIEELDLQLGPGLTVITGETGSGKSILLGALGLAMGGRADGNLLRDEAQRCVIELEVATDDGGGHAQQWCEHHGVPVEDPLILRRQLEPGGRSRAFVNDTPVRLDQLRELGERLVHVHSQHQTLLLNTPAFQLGLLDHSSGQSAAVKAYAGHYRQWRQVQEQLARTRQEQAEARNERDYLDFQQDEILGARLVAGEQEELERALARADHAEELTRALQTMEEGISGDHGLLFLLSSIRQGAAKAARIEQGVNALLDRLQSAAIELKDIAGDAAQLAGHVQVEPQEAERLRERHDLLLRLQQKHRQTDVAGLIQLRGQLAQRIAGITSLEEQVKELESQEQHLREDVYAKATAISNKRVKAMGPLAGQVGRALQELGMPHADFRFSREAIEAGPTGTDSIRALFNANRDRMPERLDKVASGGELSRVMLALISLAAASKELPTVIFDEIDTGVSGDTAHRIGALLAAMGGQRQVIAISHLPQIASRAATHLLVSKDQEAEPVHTTIRPLALEQRVEVLARMLSGSRTTKAAIENARELLKNR
ncbi:MAG: DNA repair protein RecN [Flavobacteriales bacterium]|nr:DNA repair protein RecN [Flavobacteriales bacterium]